MRDATIDEIDRLVGSATPHFAYQLRARVRELIENLPADNPTRRYGEEKMALLDRLGHASSKADEGPAESEASRTLPQAETEDEDAQANQSPAPSPRPSPEPAGRSGDRPDFIDALAAAGYTNLSVDQLIEMEQHGVTPGFIKSLHDLG